MPYSDDLESVGILGEIMFKPSAGIFVGGLAASFGGTLLVLLSAQAEEGAAMASVGLIVAVCGIVMLCIGAARALTIIDALPAAFRNLDQERTPRQSAPAAPQHGQELHHQYMQNQGYNQPPAQ
jgi:Flp pilus assembly pilin Flp